MISADVFNKTKSEYGWCSSWALWAPEPDTRRPKSGISDLAIFDQQGILDILHVDYIVVGLNISREVSAPPFANFHSPAPAGQDFKLRFALKGTPVWGAYMTDIVKGYEDKNSQKVCRALRTNPSLLNENLISFKSEIKQVGGGSAKFIALGNAVYDVLSTHFANDVEIIKAPHYAMQISKENYRDKVHTALGF